VLVLAVFGTQVEAELVDDLDAIIAEPFLPALGANLGLNPAADLVVNWRRRQRTGARTPHAARPLTMKRPGASIRLAGSLGFRHRRADLPEEFGDFVARHIVAALLGNGKSLAQDAGGFVAPAELDQAAAEQLVDFRKLRAEVQGLPKRTDGLF